MSKNEIPGAVPSMVLEYADEALLEWSTIDPTHVEDEWDLVIKAVNDDHRRALARFFGEGS